MRRVVETTPVILHHVTHSNNHLIMKRDVCGGETEAEEQSRSDNRASLTQTPQHPQVSVTAALLVCWTSDTRMCVFLNCFIHFIGKEST